MASREETPDLCPIHSIPRDRKAGRSCSRCEGYEVSTTLSLDYNSFSVAWAFFYPDGSLREVGTIKDENKVALLEKFSLIMESLMPSDVLIEHLFMGKNGATVTKLAKVHGALLWEAERHKAKVHEIYAVSWKSKLLPSKNKGSDKESLKTANEIFGLELTDHNEADACLIGEYWFKFGRDKESKDIPTGKIITRLLS